MASTAHSSYRVGAARAAGVGASISPASTWAARGSRRRPPRAKRTVDRRPARTTVSRTIARSPVPVTLRALTPVGEGGCRGAPAARAAARRASAWGWRSGRGRLAAAADVDRPGHAGMDLADERVAARLVERLRRRRVPRRVAREPGLVEPRVAEQDVVEALRVGPGDGVPDLDVHGVRTPEEVVRRDRHVGGGARAAGTVARQDGC